MQLPKHKSGSIAQRDDKIELRCGIQRICFSGRRNKVLNLDPKILKTGNGISGELFHTGSAGFRIWAPNS